jgi:hypothetical protein
LSCHALGSADNRSSKASALRASPVRDIGSLPTPGPMLPRRKAKNSTQSDIGLAASGIQGILRRSNRIRPLAEAVTLCLANSTLSRNNWFVELIVTYN